ncbi:MAG TPA: glycosyltransferase family 2 protein, partial [Intrasporangium sp.]|nr:glycosyltransferase family 2 protein [Intrasporangium sp.]
MADPAVLPQGVVDASDGFAVRGARRLSPAEAAAFAAFALRTRSLGAREVLARAATKGSLGRRATIEAMLMGGAEDGRGDFDPFWTAWFAYVETLCPDTETDVAVDLLDRAAWHCRNAGLPTTVADTRAQVLLRAGRREAAKVALDQTPVSAATRWEVECDLANPNLWPAEELDDAEWLRLLSRPFVHGGVEAVSVTAAGDTPFSRLHAAAAALPPTMTSQGMVSVVMSAFRPDRDILASARSILDQTWTNLELLVIDDASPSGSERLLAEVGALDPRVRVLHAPTNGGTYQVRNLAFREARGDFITFQDSDDWSHPRRLEVQVRALLDDPSLLATRTPAIRAHPDLSLTWPGYPAQRLNASSLLFRLREVHDLIGDFDAVRKSADTEYPRRLQAVRPNSVKDVDEHGPLAITQLRGGSLSRTDAVPGWIRWTRISYNDAYLEWHERIKIGAADPFLDSDGPRPFPIPDPTWSPWRKSTEIPRGQFDVVVLGDWRSGGATHRPLLDEMRLLASAGLRVAMAHVEVPFPLAARRQPRARAVQRLINSGVVALTHLDRHADVGLLLVVDPRTLTFLPDVIVGLSPRTVVVVNDDATARRSADIDAADRAAREAFGAVPLWTARHRRLLEELRASASQAEVDEEVLPFPVDVAGLR